MLCYMYDEWTHSQLVWKINKEKYATHHNHNREVRSEACVKIAEVRSEACVEVAEVQSEVCVEVAEVRSEARVEVAIKTEKDR